MKTRFRVFTVAAVVAAGLALAGCRVTLWAHEWGAEPVPYDACEPYCDVNPAGGYRDACGELPGVLGDDC